MLDFKCQMIIDEFDERRPLLQKIRELVNSAIQEALTENDVEVTAVEGRIKKRDSLIGKLIRKGHKYHTLDDITDLVGFRVITLYSDDVDRVASYMERMFDVDWNESIDKRKMHEMSSFGYNSLHYICRIPKTLYTDEQQPELNTIRFEVQMRSTLQHVWAAMEHDLGYKSEIETPPEYMRMYGRLAGMLELADEEFSRIRISIAAYRRRMESLIQAGELSEVLLDGDTFNSYIRQADEAHRCHQPGRDTGDVVRAILPTAQGGRHEHAARRGRLHQAERGRCLQVCHEPVRRHRHRHHRIHRGPARPPHRTHAEEWWRQTRAHPHL